tara:strand:+ start:21990 stop:22460 length:471 start_codon:yes stop_codon:yes gene_type:complete
MFLRMIYIHVFLIIFLSNTVEGQQDQLTKAKQTALSSISLIDAIATRVPGARKITDRMGNKNIALRGRQSLTLAGDEVLWDIDGVLYKNPPFLNANQVKYVEVLNGLAATNKYGSEGGAGVIVVKTNVSDERYNSRKNIWNRSNKSSKKKRGANKN